MMHLEDGFPEALGGIRLAWWPDLELTFNTDENMLGKVEQSGLPRVLKLKESNFRRKD